MAGDDPFRESHACSAGRLDSDGVEAGCNKEVFQLWCFTQQITLIGRETLRSVEEFADASLGELRHAMNGAFENRLKMIEILGQFLEAEALRNALHSPGLGLGLERADQELAGV